MWTYPDHCYIRAEKTWFSHSNGLCCKSSVLKLVCNELFFLVATVEGNGDLLHGLTQRDKHFWSSCCLHHQGRKWHFLHQWSWFDSNSLALSMTISQVKEKNLGATHNSSVISQSVMAEITHAGVEWTSSYCGKLVWGSFWTLMTIMNPLNGRIAGLLYGTLLIWTRKWLKGTKGDKYRTLK